MLEIVARVGDDGKRAGRQYTREAKRKLRAADPTRQGQHFGAARHRNKPSCSGRINAAAFESAPAHASPRNIMTGRPSSACPIRSDAADAISSAKPITVARSV